ncbi:hypothetical protein L9F63_007041, partial [Diploptera punctata]
KALIRHKKVRIKIFNHILAHRPKGRCQFILNRRGTDKANSSSNLNSYSEDQKWKFQTRVPENVRFPCATEPGSPGGRSATRPTSVHRLRPGDIDVVGAIGDSIIAGNGILSSNILEVHMETRGLSLATGGDSNWRNYLTLSNILKEFNPNIIGYAQGNAMSFMPDSKFNVAEPMAMNRDIVFQAKLLLLRMKADKNIDFEKDWKLITILMGHNDFCSDMCYRNWKALPNETRDNLKAALDYLHDNMPRTVVNLVPPLNVAIVRRITQPSAACQIYWRTVCSCFFGFKSKNHEQEFADIVEKCQQAVVVNNSRYNKKDDFAVVVQPFLVNATIPTRINDNRTDYSYLAADCFHLSQKGHAAAANSLWNNMMEPSNKKTYSLSSNVLTRFLCPTPEHPYIFTARNSQRDASRQKTI